MTSKSKNIALACGFVLALVVCYQLAISKTLSIYKTYNKLKNEELLFGNTPRQLSILKQKAKYYDSILEVNKIKGNSIQNNLLEMMSDYAKNNEVKIISFVEPHLEIQNDLKISAYQFSLEGEYNDLIKLVHKLEQETRFGEIINLHFEKKKNFKTGKYYLITSVLLKSFG